MPPGRVPRLHRGLAQLLAPGSLKGQVKRPATKASPTTGAPRESARTGLAVSENVWRRLRVNPILCDGYGYCAEIVPELISLDDWGFPTVASRPTDDDKVLRLAERAVTTCPRLALLHEDVTPDSH